MDKNQKARDLMDRLDLFEGRVMSAELAMQKLKQELDIAYRLRNEAREAVLAQLKKAEDCGTCDVCGCTSRTAEGERHDA